MVDERDQDLPPAEELFIADVRTEGMMLRAALDEATITDYAERMEAGDRFPPIRVYRDGDGRLWIADGFHRLEAAQRIGRATICADLWVGSKQEALIAAIPCNIKHGLRRTNADKRKAVTILLADESWRQKSDVTLARYAAVSDRFVAGLRTELSSNGSIMEKRVVERNGTTYTMEKKALTRAAPSERDSDAPTETIEEEALRLAAAASGIPQETIIQALSLKERRPDLYERVRGEGLDLETAHMEMTAQENEAFIADTVAKTGFTRDDVVRDLCIAELCSRSEVEKMDAAGLSPSAMLRLALTEEDPQLRQPAVRRVLKIGLSWDFNAVAEKIAAHYTKGELTMLMARLRFHGGL